MNRFEGMVGYGESQEVPADSGTWVMVITEFPYIGTLVRQTRRLEEGESLNDNVSAGTSISIVADEKANADWKRIKYVIWQGEAWKVSSVEVARPRLILNIGDLYKGPRA